MVELASHNGPTSAPENPPNLKEGEWETLSMSTISWFKLTKPAGSREMARSNQHHVQRDRMALKQAGEIRHHHRKLRERWDRAVLKTDELKAEELDEAERSHGIHETQFKALRAVQKASEEGGGVGKREHDGDDDDALMVTSSPSPFAL